MERMKIIAYSDEKFSAEIGSMELQVVPKDYQGKKGIKYDAGEQQGQNVQSQVFSGYTNEEFSIHVLIDCTGVIPGTKDSDTVSKKIKQLESLVYQYNSDKHQANFVALAWGTLLFKGRLKEMQAVYELFSQDGMPIRAKVAMTFVQFVSRDEADKLANRQSPDMSHVVTLKAGDTIAALCRRIYGDSSLVDEVARVNGLNGFRHIMPGTVLLFPHLSRDSE